MQALMLDDLVHRVDVFGEIIIYRECLSATTTRLVLGNFIRFKLLLSFKAQFASDTWIWFSLLFQRSIFLGR